MNKVLNKQTISRGIKRLDVLASEIAAKIQPGQFVMVAAVENSERIALPVVDADPKKGSIALIFQEDSPAAQALGEFQINQEIPVILGPLGTAVKIAKYGTVVCLTTGMSVTHMLPIVRALKKAGNKVVGIMGAKNKKSLLLEPQMRLMCNKLYVVTEDGSYIKRGLATDALKEVLKTEKIHAVFSSGSIEMMQTTATITGQKKIKAWAIVNPLMLDGTGVCGSCRVTVAGETVLACVRGPVFDAHQLDYEDLKVRMNAYSTENFLKGIEESWDNPTSRPPVQSDGLKISRKSLLGFLKPRP